DEAHARAEIAWLQVAKRWERLRASGMLADDHAPRPPPRRGDHAAPAESADAGLIPGPVVQHDGCVLRRRSQTARRRIGVADRLAASGVGELRRGGAVRL